MQTAPRWVPAPLDARTTDFYKLLGVAPRPLLLTEREVRLEIRPRIRGWRAALGKSPRLWAEHVELTARPNSNSPIGAVVQIEVPTGSLIVSSTDIKVKDRRRIEQRLRRDVLQSHRYPSLHIDIRDLIADNRGDAIAVRARCRLRGIDQDVRFTLRRRSAGLYEADVTLMMSEFGIPPIGSFLGGMKIDDELSIHLKLNMRAMNASLDSETRQLMANLPGLTLPEHQPDIRQRPANDD